jgi:hypothetical protein
MEADNGDAFIALCRDTRTDVNAVTERDHKTALMLSIDEYHEYFNVLLLKIKARTDIRDSSNKTAYDHAVEWKASLGSSYGSQWMRDFLANAVAKLEETMKARGELK